MMFANVCSPKYPVADCQSNGCVPYLFAFQTKVSKECFAQAQLSPTAISVSRISTMLENEKESLSHLLCELVLIFPIKFIIIIRLKTDY